MELCPTEHGEVFVGEDGIEADQDLGNYERLPIKHQRRFIILPPGRCTKR